MKKLIIMFGVAVYLIFGNSAIAEVKLETDMVQDVTKKPSCVLMKFGNASRYRVLDSDEVFADYVLEKLLVSKQFDLKEMQPMSEEMEKELYDEKYIHTTNISKLNEGGGFGKIFDANNDVPIDKADKGQRINPELAYAIGKQNEADYLIQGTIVGISSGQESDFFMFSEKARIGVIGDLRIIKASTGEVIWKHRETGEGKQGSIRIPAARVGKAVLNSNLYVRAMDELAQKLVDAMLADIKCHKLNLG